MIRRLTLVTVVTGLMVALGVTVAQATTVPPLTIPSGTEVIPHITFDADGSSLVKLYDPATGKDETISSTEGTDSFLWRPQLSVGVRLTVRLGQSDAGPSRIFPTTKPEGISWTRTMYSVPIPTVRQPHSADKATSRSTRALPNDTAATSAERLSVPAKAPLCIGDALPKRPSSWC